MMTWTDKIWFERGLYHWELRSKDGKTVYPGAPKESEDEAEASIRVLRAKLAGRNSHERLGTNFF